ncbi:3-dehydro-L-gulonate 2-dehydrogenase [bacterium]|nr:3-dehydro-L-gulonate 2-dehydrogenase [bacterium]
MRIPFNTMYNEFLRILTKTGFTEDRACLCARLFAESSLDGVYSHGVNRFPVFVDYIRRGIVRIHNRPELVSGFGPLERWEGNLGPGNLNAYECMNRAIALARAHGMGCVALRNTNHWMRGGTYGWQAAEANCLAVCFTNTLPNMPPWGATDKRVGNNPLILAVPRSGGHIVLDMAMSQFSYGKMHEYQMTGKKLPVLGGFDSSGALTDEPGSILKSGRFLPMGYWKGSGLAIMLDLFAAILSEGQSTRHLGHEGDEYGVSQVFMAWSAEKLESTQALEAITREVLDFIHDAAPEQEGGRVYYPGERTLLTRKDNREHGIPVQEAVWEQIIGL